ncbi:MAG: adenylosuccinate lyase [Saprospiraceae bacterium]|nr:adenylosuccinate lyase [Saprospiraceae bacterium]
MLKAISPIDGRYRDKTKVLSDFFSEYALIKYRVLVEVEYFLFLASEKLKGLDDFPGDRSEQVRRIASNFSMYDAERVKEIEKETNHDVKAVEYFLKEKFSSMGLDSYSEMIHFGLTSQDVNNTAVPLSIKEALHTTYLPLINALKENLQELGRGWRSIPMLARTHGQPASPTTVGKELFVFADRLSMQIFQLQQLPFKAKFGGATGNFNAHAVTYPHVDWIAFGNRFVEHFGLERLRYTTQIDHYDQLASLCHNICRINTILIDLCRDLWTYISQNYFTQKVVEHETGSSTMPHKVNPIDFENAEGNLGVANAILTHLANKLPISRLQRDLTDSTVLRNIGVPFAHSLIAMQSLTKGLGKIAVNEEVTRDDLGNNWAVVTEAYQSILRREGVKEPYELLKSLSRGNHRIDQKTLHLFIDNLAIDDKVKEELKKITPFNYTGLIDL